MQAIICLQFMTEKEVGHGEDAPPILIVRDGAYAVGVFDGMGGAGASTCDSAWGEVTKAFVASRIIKDAVQTFLVDNLDINEIAAGDLKEVVTKRLKEEQEKFPPKNRSLLRSKLVREYPTTMALITLREIESKLLVDSYWAGDSHCYLWIKEGFFQISKDDLEEDNDPMKNLHNDSPISNCICADRDFCIHHKQIVIAKEPVVILCATDGCFGYYQTPMHFEHMLKRCLYNARDEKTWKEVIVQSIQKVTGDDTSLSLIGVGFESFGKFKNAMTTKPVPSIKRINVLEEEMISFKTKWEKKSHEYENTIKSGWDVYKQNYMKYLNDEENADV